MNLAKIGVHADVAGAGAKGPDGPPPAIAGGLGATHAIDSPAAIATAVAAVTATPVAAIIAAAGPLVITAAPTAAIVPAVAAPTATMAGPTAGPAGAPVPGLGQPNIPEPLNDPEALQVAIEGALAMANQPLPVLPGRWYVVTRRWEVGVFQGWASVSPLVSAVPNTCHERGGARIKVYRSSRPSQDEDLPRRTAQPSVFQRHITYSFLGNGKVTTRTSFLDTVDDHSRASAVSGSVEHGDMSNVDSIVDSSTWRDRYSDLDVKYIHNIELDEVEGQARKRTAADNPLLQWVPKIDNWLAELICLEGRCSYTDELRPACQTNQATIRCEDCQDLRLYCTTCTVNRHAQSPFHRLKAWTDTHFRRETLKNLGLRLQLGHAPGDQCPNPIRAFSDDFVVVDISGIHEIGLDFCGCEITQFHPTQLLRNRMLPATSVDPKTAATFHLLETFHLISAQFKISGYEFYTALARRTDNTGVNPPKDRYPAFMRMMCEWRHLKMLKCSGRGHDPGGVAATLPGSYAVLCPACPHPGKNLPVDWADVPKDKRLFLSIDANFRLKCKKVSSDQVDPGLNHGYAYFVEEKAYKEHLRTYDKAFSDEISTCNNHDALKLASMKGAHQSTAASGIGTVDCA
ncbi:hypothetical protein SCP_0200330 [Sparassis crispa]|uniref:CxC2-like cysteine cluster KDZ transposase-associated domain-containing protein n=1 Tax=Sparassis crispa TaxID=139825 RepID=A0A401G9H5_9APHY|nr:hypothetical protein SCP_0200330 [Sparassis crispa]GBE78836.1 hypothetical protein SCP_0200330 [Sparassis crispa]